MKESAERGRTQPEDFRQVRFEESFPKMGVKMAIHGIDSSFILSGERFFIRGAAYQTAGPILAQGGENLEQTEEARGAITPAYIEHLWTDKFTNCRRKHDSPRRSMDHLS